MPMHEEKKIDDPKIYLDKEVQYKPIKDEIAPQEGATTC
jgi:hypothetical protein